MARNDFLTLKSRVLDELHDSALSSKVGNFVNETINIIHSRTDHKFLKATGTLSTIATQQEYTISTAINANVDTIIAITSRDPEVYLQEFNKQDIEFFDPDYTDESTDPWAYYVQNTLLGLYPTPNAVKTLYVDYIKFSSDLAADGDVTDIPLRWTQVIVDGAVYRGLKYLRPGNPSVWTAQEAIFEKGLSQMVVLNQNKPNQRFRFKAVNEVTPGPVPPRIQLWKT